MGQARREDVEQALGTIVAQFGPAAIERPDRLRALLHDLLGDSARTLRPEIDAVVAVARRGSPASGTPFAPEGSPGAPATNSPGGPPTSSAGDHLDSWARSALAGALAVRPTELPGTALPPSTGPEPQRSSGPVPTPKGDGSGSTGAGPGGNGGDAGTGESPAGGGAPARRRAAPLVATAAAAVVVVVASAVGLSLASRDSGADALAGGSVGGQSSARGTGEPTTPRSPSLSPSPSSSPAAAGPTSCSTPTEGAVRAEYDVRHGLDLTGTLSDPQQHQVLTAAASSTGLAVNLNDFLTEGGTGPSPSAVQTLAGILPVVLLNLSDVSAVAAGDEVCLEGSFIDEEARDELETAAADLQARGGRLTLLLEQHPVDDHRAHEAVLQAAITQAVDNQRIPFVTGSAELLPEAGPILDRVVHVLNERFPERRYPGLVVTVEGHTDDVGSREANLALSQARAESVMRALVARGVPPSRLHAVGHGPDQPLTTNATEEGRQTNRRVVFNVGKDHEGAVHGGQAPGGGAHEGH